VGEGVIYDLRSSLFARLQRMSLRFFTNTKVGELMSRLNNDVVGAQNAISNTIVGIVTNIIEAIAILAVMLTLEWRLTLVSVLILPLFISLARVWARSCATSPAGMDMNAADERPHERDAQHRRGAAGQAVRARQRGGSPLP
jgi:ATP-binding cassette, subfamily B, bacterial